MRPLASAVLLLLAAVGGVAAQSATPGRWLPPDSATIVRLQGRLAGRDRIRVVTDFMPLEIRRPTADSTGIGSLLQPGQALAWPEVSHIQVRTSAFSRGLLVGSLIGGSLGLVVGLSGAHECTGAGWFEWCDLSAGDVATLTVGGALAFGLLGGLVAAPFGRWATVYEAQQRPWTPTVTVLPVRDGVGVHAALSF
jgi:hypothetical protein